MLDDRPNGIGVPLRQTPVPFSDLDTLGNMSREIHLKLKPEIMKEVEAAARERCMPTRYFMEEVLETVAATRRLATLPPIPKKPGGKPDLFERLNLK